MEVNSAKKYILDLLFSQNQCKNNCIFGLDVQALQNAKSICLPSEVISFFPSSFSSMFLAAYCLALTCCPVSLGKKNSELWICAEEVCVLCALSPVPPCLPDSYTTITMNLHHIYHVAGPVQAAEPLDRSHKQVTVAFGNGSLAVGEEWLELSRGNTPGAGLIAMRL